MPDKKVALVVGASRGIGRQIAVDLAKDGYAVVVAAKTTSDAATASPFPPDPNSPQSTINTVEREIREAGGTATALAVDTRDFESVRGLVGRTVEIYKRLDVVIYNSGAIWWASIEDTPMKRFQLMQRVNVEGLYGTIQASLPHLKQSVGIDNNTTTTTTTSDTSSPRPLLDNDSTQEKQSETAKAQRLRGSGRVIVVSPPIYSRFFRGKTAYAMGKVGMSVLTKGLAMDFERQGVADRMAITSIWPAVAIESAATRSMQLNNPEEARDLRKSTIFSDAILVMLRCPAATINGGLELDEDFLRSPEGGGVTDFDKYALVPRPRNVDQKDWEPPRRIMPKVLPDLSVAEQDDQGRRMDSAAKVKQKAKL